MEKKKTQVLSVQNIPSPYRVDFYYYLQNRETEYDISFLYTAHNEDNRVWTIDETKLGNTHFLDAKVIKLKKEMDNHYIHLPFSIYRKLNELCPDVVISWEYNPAALLCYLWCVLHHKAFVHGTDGTLHSERNSGKLQRLSRRFIIGHAKTFLASSTKAKEKLMAWGAEEERIFISLLTENLEAYHRIADMANDREEKEPMGLLYVGSFIRRKGLDLLLNSLPYVKGNYQLHIVGNGSREERDKLMQQAQELGVQDRIVWKGFLEGEELLREYHDAAVFVLPTREDCFGLVLLEALGSGTPIVTSCYADGAYDIVEDGVTGFIVDPENPVELAEAIDRLIGDPKRLQAAARRSIELSEKFDYSVTVKGYDAAIAHAVEVYRASGDRG